MEQLVKQESQKLLAKQANQARVQRQLQVRQQAMAWTEATRRKFEEAKERELRLLADALTEQARNAALRNIEILARQNDLAMAEIGMAHRAASGFQNVERLKSLKRLKNEEIAKNRGTSAMLKLAEANQARSATSLAILKRKEAVRKAEDQKSKELISRRPPLGISNSNATSQSTSREKLGQPYFDQNLAKTLHIPSTGRSSVRASKTTSRVSFSASTKDVHDLSNEDASIHASRKTSKTSTSKASPAASHSKKPSSKSHVTIATLPSRSARSSSIEFHERRRRQTPHVKEGVLADMVRIKTVSSKPGHPVPTERPSVNVDEDEDVNLAQQFVEEGIKIRDKYKIGLGAIEEVPLSPPTSSSITSPPVASATSPPTPPPPVRYFDLKLPKGEVQYIAPEGLVVKESSDGPNAWEEGRKSSREINEQQKQRTLTEEEKQQKAAQRGKKAMKKAKLEKELTEVRNELLKQVENYDIMGTGSQKAILGLDDDEKDGVKASSDEFSAVESGDEDFTFPKASSGVSEAPVATLVKVIVKQGGKGKHPGDTSISSDVDTSSTSPPTSYSITSPPVAPTAGTSTQPPPVRYVDLKLSTGEVHNVAPEGRRESGVAPNAQEEGRKSSRKIVEQHKQRTLTEDEKQQKAQRSKKAMKKTDAPEEGTSREIVEQRKQSFLTDEEKQQKAAERGKKAKKKANAPEEGRKSLREIVEPRKQGSLTEEEKQQKAAERGKKAKLEKELTEVRNELLKQVENYDTMGTGSNLGLNDDEKDGKKVSSSDEFSAVESGDEDFTFPKASSGVSEVPADATLEKGVKSKKPGDTSVRSDVDTSGASLPTSYSITSPPVASTTGLSTQPPPVRYVETRLPTGEGQYVTPEGLVVKQSSEGPNAPEEGRKSSREIAKQRQQSSLTEEQKQQKVAERGKKAKKKANAPEEGRKSSREIGEQQKQRTLTEEEKQQKVAERGKKAVKNANMKKKLALLKQVENNDTMGSGSQNAGMKTSSSDDFSAVESEVEDSTFPKASPGTSETPSDATLVNIIVKQGGKSKKPGDTSIISDVDTSGTSRSSENGTSSSSQSTDYYVLPEGPFTSTPDGKLRQARRNSASVTESSSRDDDNDRLRLRRIRTLKYYFDKFVERRPESIEKLSVVASSDSVIRIDSEAVSRSTSMDSSGRSGGQQTDTDSSDMSPVQRYSKAQQQASRSHTMPTLSENSQEEGTESSGETIAETAIVAAANASLLSSDNNTTSGSGSSSKENSSSQKNQTTSGSDCVGASSLDESYPEVFIRCSRPREEDTTTTSNSSRTTGSSPKSGPERETERLQDQLLNDVSPAKLWETPPRLSRSAAGVNQAEQLSMVFDQLFSKWSNVQISPPPWYSKTNFGNVDE